LERVDDRAERALKVDLRRRSEHVGELGHRLVLARGAVLERARTVEARRSDSLVALTARLIQARLRDTERRQEKLDALASLLGSLSYRAVLDRGFALVRDGEGRSLRRAEDAATAPRLSLQFADGTVEALPVAAERMVRRGASRGGARPAPAKQGTLFEV
jgi:exodeoxyribonuclease VII large subunit